MFQRRHQQFGRRARRALEGALRALLVLGFATFPVLAFDAPAGAGLPPSAGGGGTGGSNEVAGDETIGTLPIVGPTAPFDLLRSIVEREPCFYLEGNRLDLFGAIVSVAGRTVATLRMIDPATDTVRVTFHGRPRLVLDRAAIDSGALGFGIDVPTAFGQGAVQSQLGARALAPAAIGPGVHELPSAPFAASNLLLQRRLEYELLGQDGAHTVLGLRATRRYLIVDQTH